MIINKKLLRLFFSLILFLVAFKTSLTEAQELQATELGNKHVKTSIIFDRVSLQPGASIGQPAGKIAVKFEIEPGWHIYWKNSGESAIPTRINWTLPVGWNSGSLEWPVPYKFIERGNIKTFGYKNEVILSSSLFSPGEDLNIPQNKELNFKADVEWLVCKDICVPGRSILSKEIIYSSTLPLQASSDKDTFDLAEANTPSREISNGLDIRAIEPLSEIVPGSESLVGLSIDKELNKNDVQFFPISTPLVSTVEGKILSSGGLTNLVFPVKLGKNIAVGRNKIEAVLAFRDNTPLKIEIPFRVVSSKSTENNFLDEVYQRGELASYKTLGLKTENKTKVTDSVKAPEQSTFLVLLLAFLAGVILNLMPCVLPVISIKALSLINKTENSKSKRIKSSLAYLLGVQLTFILLATLVIFLQSLGKSIGWGFQFQSPEFVIALCLVVFILALSFFDLFTIGAPRLGRTSSKVDKMSDSILKDIFDGMLTTALATPCTAPFLGTALAFAFAGGSLTILAVFLSIGFGLALPYMCFTNSPRLMALLPKPGDWMYTFRQLMGFLLFGTVVWLLFVLDKLTEAGSLWLVFLMLVATFLIWALGKVKDLKTPIAIASLALFIVLTNCNWDKLTATKNLTQTKESHLIDWENYSEKLVSNALSENRTVFIDFTAEWCVTCKANENLVIETSEVSTAFKKNNVLPLIADWTTGSEKITKALNKYQGNAVPHYVVINASGDFKVLPTVLTKQLLIDAVNVASK